MPLKNCDEIRLAYIAAINAGDTGAMAELFTEDCVVAPPEMPSEGGKAGVKSIYGAQFAAFNIILSIKTEEEVVLDDWGYWRGTWKAGLTPKAVGEAVEAEGKYLCIIRREADGGWKIHRNMWNTPTPLLMMATT
ncbi:MAG: YybH family protein [Bryobacteraceae bacterium]